ncbi:MAG: HAD-IA family hydrolase [Lachnospiraceae bacterium]|nr:HAD-IA family hydrolase [Lachnospiraceae bacterium]
MKVKAVLFDLDGMLLPMDYDGFLKCYFGNLAKRLAKYGYDPDTLVKNIWTGTGAMVKNDGSCMNETRFWDVFADIYGVNVLQDKVLFDDFYREDFVKAKEACGFEPMAKEVVEEVKRKGLVAVLATNPIFPMIATRQRMEWAGLSAEDFKLCTTYENIGYSKPNPAYYTEIAKRIGVAPEECLMVGNDVSEDMVAAKVGMQVFLLTDCLLNKKEEDFSGYPQGGFSELLEYLKAL